MHLIANSFSGHTTLGDFNQQRFFKCKVELELFFAFAMSLITTISYNIVELTQESLSTFRVP